MFEQSINKNRLSIT